MAFRDGSGLTIHRNLDATVRSLARLNEKDAATFRELALRFGNLADSVFQLRYGPPRAPFEMAQPFPQELIPHLARYFSMSIYQAVDSHFEDERIRAFFKVMFHANLLDDLPGSGFYFPMLFTLLTDVGRPVGGAANMALALARLVRAHGGEVMTNAHVKRIIVDGGVARGLELADGRRIEATQFVASSIDAPQTVRLAGEEHFSASVNAKMKAWKYAVHSVAVLHVALDEAPRYKAAAFDPALAECFDVVLGADSTTDVRSAMADITAGKIPQVLMGNGSANTLFDPGYAPAGKHIAWWGVSVPPADLDGPGVYTDAARADLRERMLAAWREFAPNMTDANILGSYLFAPPDIAAHAINMARGGHHMGVYHVDQVGVNRPHPELAGYRTPVKGLYLCGSSHHPGGAITGAPAYNAAAVLAAELGATRWWPKQTGMA